MATDKLSRARELVAAGKSRRATDKILKQEYPKSISHDTWGKLYKTVYRVVTVKNVGYKHPTTKRQRRFNQLRKWGFTWHEATMLSTAVHHLRNSDAIRRMRNDRAVILRRVERDARRYHWNKSRIEQENRAAIKAFYKSGGSTDRNPAEKAEKDQWTMRGALFAKGLSDKNTKGKDDVWAWYDKSRSTDDEAFHYPKRKGSKTQKFSVKRRDASAIVARLKNEKRGFERMKAQDTRRANHALWDGKIADINKRIAKYQEAAKNA